MGTYTTNYQLYMPSIGEQGWGELVNNNFSTIDTTMNGLDTRVGMLETETDAIDSRIKVFEDNISFDSNGNIVGNFNGEVLVNVSTAGDASIGYYGVVVDSETATRTHTSGGTANGPTINIQDISVVMKKGFKAYNTLSYNLSGNLSLSGSSGGNNFSVYVYLNGSQIAYANNALTVSFNNIVVKSGDILTTKVGIASWVNASSPIISTLTLSNPTTKLYLAYK